MRRQVNCALVRMYDAYVKNEKGRGEQNNMSTKLSERLIRSSSSCGPMGVRPSLRIAQFVREIKEDSLEKTGAERYLAKGIVKLHGQFDIYIYIYIFSMIDHVLDFFHNSSSSKMVEGLICVQD